MTNDAFGMLGGAGAAMHPMSCVIYTADACLSGTVQTASARFSDAFNAFSERMVEIADATIQTVVEGQPKVEAAATAFVRLSDIVFCYPAEAEPMRPATDATVRRERQRRQVVLLLNGRSVTGEAHLAAGTTLAHYANARSETFLSLTSATITRYGSSITLPFVLVNTGMVSSLYSPEITAASPAPLPMRSEASHAAPQVDAGPPTPREEAVSVIEALRNAVLHATSGPALSQGGGNGALSRWLERRTVTDRRDVNVDPPGVPVGLTVADGVPVTGVRVAVAVAAGGPLVAAVRKELLAVQATAAAPPCTRGRTRQWYRVSVSSANPAGMV